MPSRARTVPAVLTHSPLPLANPHSDFFPHGYLTGFFTSRPALKGYIRASSSVFNAARQLQSFTGGAPDMTPANPLYKLERALGVTQHHDAVTGSSKQAVAFDYAKMLAGGRADADGLIASALSRLAGGALDPTSISSCDLANATICGALESGQPTALFVYNPLGQSRDVNVVLPVGLPAGVASWSVTGASGAPLAAQLLPMTPTDTSLRRDYYRYYPSPCDAIVGTWTNPSVPASGNAFDPAANVPSYRISWSARPGSSFDVANEAKNASSWATAQGVLAADNSSASIVFFSAAGAQIAKETVGVSSQCDTFFFPATNTWSADAYTWRLVNTSSAMPVTPPTQWLAFQVPAVPAAGYTTIFLLPSSTVNGAPLTLASRPTRPDAHGGDETLSNGDVTLTFDGTTQLLKSFARSDGFALPLDASLLFYESSVGTPDAARGISGAYIFRPNSSTAFPPSESPPSVEFIRGPVVWEARMVYAPWASAVIRLWTESTALEIEYTIGPIPIEEGGKEIIARYDTPLASAATWFTDANGRDSNRRVRDHRASWNLSVEEPVSGNYYPVSAFTFLTDAVTGATLSVLPDRAQGGASIRDGSLELMIHRRLAADDALGVGEILTEPGLAAGDAGLRIRTTHVLVLEPTPDAAAVSRRAALSTTLWHPLLRFTQLGSEETPAAWAAAHRVNFTALATSLPPNVHLLTAHSLGPRTLLLRLSHNFEAGEGGNSSSAVSVALSNIFEVAAVALGACTEMTVTGNQPLADAPQSTYNVTGGGAVTLPIIPSPPAGATQTIEINALEIRTFQCIATFGVGV